MPLYGYRCDCGHQFDEHHTMAQATSLQSCPSCGALAMRTYGFYKDKEFQSFFDDQYKCEIRSAKQERKLMKKHGHINTRDTGFFDKYKSASKWAKKTGSTKGWTG